MSSSDSPFTLGYDGDAGQVILEGLPAGPAGGASLIPADGVELLFDRADGRLSQVFVDAGEPGGPSPAGEAIGTLFGSRVRAAIRQARLRDGTPVSLEVEPDVMATLSRLARLDAARVISHVAHSPWWAVEAAQLASRAGLSARAATETRRALRALEADPAGARHPGIPGIVARTVADLVEATEPGLAARLRARGREDAVSSPDRPPGSQPADAQTSDGRLQWCLDPRLAPAGVFRYQLWPGSDLTVRAGRRGIVVEAELAPGGDRHSLERSRARLVDPARRRVIGAAPFGNAGDRLVRAEIHQRIPAAGMWVEVVDDERRPVLSARLHRIRRAMRWADAALYASRRSPGLGDAEWARMAAIAWVRCSADWLAAGDGDRAYLAAVRCAAIRPDAPVPVPPSSWAKELADRSQVADAPFLAEAVPDPAS